MQEQQSGSILTIEQRKKITMTCVESVDSFSEARIVLTVLGQKVTIDGAKLKILNFSQGSGGFSASGDIRAVKYGGGKSELRGIFK